MEYSKIMSANGLPGLFEFVAKQSDGAIVNALDGSNTKYISNRVNPMSQIINIEVFTTRENVNLIEVFHAMQNSTEPLPSDKDPKVIKAYFMIVFPTMDFDRVYPSDMKKMVKWFSILHAANVTLELPAEEEEETD